MPLIVVVIFTVIPAIIAAAMVAGITGLPEIDYQTKAKEKALSVYHQTGSIHSTVTFLGRDININSNEIDLSEIKKASYKDVQYKKASIEQAIVNVCITLYKECGRDSRMSPVYNSVRYSNLASSYSVTVAPDKNGYLKFDSVITGGGNGYVYYGIWNGSYTIQTGDKLVYAVYVPSGLPAYIVGGFEMDFSDGTYGRSYNLRDQNNRANHWSDLSVYAGKWYYREFALTNVVGKTISYFNLVNESDTAGTYNGILYKNIQIINGNAVRLRIWDPSYLWAFLDMKDGQVSTLLTTGTTQSTINCSTATETEFNQYGRHLLRNALGTSAIPPVILSGVSRNFYYSKPAGGQGCGFTDIVELR
jgi:hypothetical protein